MISAFSHPMSEKTSDNHSLHSSVLWLDPSKYVEAKGLVRDKILALYINLSKIIQPRVLHGQRMESMLHTTYSSRSRLSIITSTRTKINNEMAEDG